MDSHFPIDQLQRRAAERLEASGYRPPASGRVRPVPDTRTIRYYTTLGLIDRPAAMAGRQALYHDRHVDQLVAIKRMQTAGLTLSDIQYRMLSMSEDEIRRWRPQAAAKSEPNIESTSQSSDTTSGDSGTPEPPRPTPASDSPASDSPASEQPTIWREIPLPGGVRLSVPGPNVGGDPPRLDRQRLDAAAWALLAELERQGLIDSVSNVSFSTKGKRS